MSEAEAAPKKQSITYFDIKEGTEPIGRVIFKLYDDIVPRTADNFSAYRLVCGKDWRPLTETSL